MNDAAAAAGYADPEMRVSSSTKSDQQPQHSTKSDEENCPPPVAPKSSAARAETTSDLSKSGGKSAEKGGKKVLDVAHASAAALPSPVYGVRTNIDEKLCMTTSDLYESMRIVETEFVSPETYNPDAFYVPYRRYFVDWLSDVGEQFHLHPTTVHTAVLFLDKIFRENGDNKQCPPREKWQLLATACLSVAAKYEEAEEHCPPIPKLLRVTKLNLAGVTPLSFRDGELEVLQALFWTLRAVSPLHVLGYHLSKGVTFVEDEWQGRPLIDKIPRCVGKYCDFFANLTLQNYAFQRYVPSLLAAAIVAASRRTLKVEPHWRPELTVLTGYNFEDVRMAFEHVWEYFEEQFPDHVAVSGQEKTCRGSVGSREDKGRFDIQSPTGVADADAM